MTPLEELIEENEEHTQTAWEKAEQSGCPKDGVNKWFRRLKGQMDQAWPRTFPKASWRTQPRVWGVKTR